MMIRFVLPNDTIIVHFEYRHEYALCHQGDALMRGDSPEKGIFLVTPKQFLYV